MPDNDDVFGLPTSCGAGSEIDIDLIASDAYTSLNAYHDKNESFCSWSALKSSAHFGNSLAGMGFAIK